jgi:hypothetical protein
MTSGYWCVNFRISKVLHAGSNLQYVECIHKDTSLYMSWPACMTAFLPCILPGLQSWSLPGTRPLIRMQLVPGGQITGGFASTHCTSSLPDPPKAGYKYLVSVHCEKR